MPVEYASDTFNRANNADIGTVWDAGYTSQSALQLVNERVRGVTIAVGATETYNAVTFPAAQYAQVTVATFQGAILAEAMVALRFANPATHSGYFFMAVRNDGALRSQIRRSNSGSLVTLASENVTTWAAGDILRGEAEGSTLRLYRNEVLLLTASDDTHPTGRAGLSTYVHTAGNLADCELDDFRCGALDRVPTIKNVRRTRG